MLQKNTHESSKVRKTQTVGSCAQDIISLNEESTVY